MWSNDNSLCNNYDEALKFIYLKKLSTMAQFCLKNTSGRWKSHSPSLFLDFKNHTFNIHLPIVANQIIIFTSPIHLFTTTL